MMELQKDIMLDWRSVSAKQGHFGSSTEYIASEHRVVHRSWGAKRRLLGILPPKAVPSTKDYLDIPETITTEKELRAYVKRQRPYWLRGL